MDMEYIRMALHKLCHLTCVINGKARPLRQLTGHSQLDEEVLPRRLMNGITALIEEPKAIFQTLRTVLIFAMVGFQAQEPAEKAHIIGHMQHAHIIANAL